MEPAPPTLTETELDELGKYNTAISPVYKHRPAPEHGPKANELVLVAPPNPGKFSDEYHQKMTNLQQRFDYWERVDLEANGKVIDLTTDDGRPNGSLLIPWDQLPENERW